MNFRWHPGMATLLALLPTLLWCAAGHAQDYRAPRTDSGAPDLAGIWNFNDTTPFERPERFGEREFLTAGEIAARDARQQESAVRREARETDLAQRVLDVPTNDPGAYNAFWSEYEEPSPGNRTSMIVYPRDGRIPATRPGVEVQESPPGHDACNENGPTFNRPVRISWGAASCDRPEDFGLATRCLIFPQTGPPHIKANTYNNNIRIVQTTDHIVIHAELGNDPRIIPLDARPHIDPRIRFWNGNSRGHFEGDTLVVVTRNMRAEVASLFQRTTSYGNAANRVLTERFTRVGDNAMDYEFTIDDPATFTDRITVKTNLSLLDGEMFEYACHEGNYALTNMLRAARIEDVSGN